MIAMQYFVQGIYQQLLKSHKLEFWFLINTSGHLYCRCCEYAYLVLEHWPDAPEIHRSADLYEDLIKCCVSDAMSEVAL